MEVAWAEIRPFTQWQSVSSYLCFLIPNRVRSETLAMALSHAGIGWSR